MAEAPTQPAIYRDDPADLTGLSLLDEQDWPRVPTQPLALEAEKLEASMRSNRRSDVALVAVAALAAVLIAVGVI